MINCNVFLFIHRRSYDQHELLQRTSASGFMLQNVHRIRYVYRKPQKVSKFFVTFKSKYTKTNHNSNTIYHSTEANRWLLWLDPSHRFIFHNCYSLVNKCNPGRPISNPQLKSPFGLKVYLLIFVICGYSV